MANQDAALLFLTNISTTKTTPTKKQKKPSQNKTKKTVVKRKLTQSEGENAFRDRTEREEEERKESDPCSPLHFAHSPPPNPPETSPPLSNLSLLLKQEQQPHQQRPPHHIHHLSLSSPREILPPETRNESKGEKPRKTASESAFSASCSPTKDKLILSPSLRLKDGDDDAPLRKKATHRVWKMPPSSAGTSTSPPPFSPSSNTPLSPAHRPLSPSPISNTPLSPVSLFRDSGRKGRKRGGSMDWGEMGGGSGAGEEEVGDGFVLGGRRGSAGGGGGGEGVEEEDKFFVLLPPREREDEGDEEEGEGEGECEDGDRDGDEEEAIRFCAGRISFGRVYFCVSTNNSTVASAPPPPTFLYSCSSKVYKKKKEKISNLETNEKEEEREEEGEEGGRGEGGMGGRRGVCHLRGEWIEVPENETKYDPLELDDPQLQKGKHRTVMTFPSCRISLLPHVKKKELKEDLNEQFAARQPLISAEIKLSTIRNAKQHMLEVGISEGIELQIISTAVIIYEKVLLKRSIQIKGNEKPIAGSCLYLAVKFVDDRSSSKSFLAPVLEAISKEFSVSKESILDEEMTILKAINFGVFVDPKNVRHHIERLKAILESKFADYQVEKYLNQCSPHHVLN